MKILFFASHPNLTIGYSRIGNILSNYLAEKGHQVYYFCISNFKINMLDRYIHPNIILIDALEEEKKMGNNELYGVNSICDQIKIIKPDILFLYNDIIVISRIFNNFNERKIDINFKILTYLDLVYPYEKIKLIKHIDSYSHIILVFSEYWKEHLIKIGIDENKIKLLYHGFDNNLFYPLEYGINPKKYFNFNSDDFIILNTNRNNYRKGIDITINSFVKFLKLQNMNKRIKLFLNMNTNNDNNLYGYDILNQFEISCIENDLNYNDVIINHVYIRGHTTSYNEQELNLLYNACDVGINTCVGEGFGLCNLEHGGIGKPQIVSNVGGLSDIFNKEYSFPINPTEKLYVSNMIEFHGGYIQICPVDGFVEGLNKYFSDPELTLIHGKKCMDIINEKYNWKTILDGLNNLILHTK